MFHMWPMAPIFAAPIFFHQDFHFLLEKRVTWSESPPGLPTGFLTKGPRRRFLSNKKPSPGTDPQACLGHVHGREPKRHMAFIQ